MIIDFMDEGRRKFILNTTATGAAAFAAVIGGAGLYGMARSLSPSQDIVAFYKHPIFDINLMQMKAGESHLFGIGSLPWILWRRSADDLKEARSLSSLDELRDTNARSVGEPNLLALDENRSFGPVGEFIMIQPICTNPGGCFLQIHQGDYNGFFCNCCAVHYDCSGRIRTSAPRNLSVFRPTLDETGTHIILDSRFARMMHSLKLRVNENI